MLTPIACPRELNSMEIGHIRNSHNVQDLKRFMAHIIEHGHINLETTEWTMKNGLS